MESNIKDPVKPISEESGSNVVGSDNPEQRISELSTALGVVKTKFTSYRKKIKTQIWFWGIICLAIIGGSILLGEYLLREEFPNEWTWQIGYISIIRITIAGAIFSLTAFCFKIFRSYVLLNEQNSHSITVIESMANLVGAAKDEQQRNLIYGKLIDIIINFGRSGFLSTGDEFKNVANISLETIQKLLTKKE